MSPQITSYSNGFAGVADQFLGEFHGKPSEPCIINRLWNENNTPETESEPTMISI
jgi:hypothetical protein